MARLTVRAALLSLAVSAVCGCFRATPVDPGARAVTVVTPSAQAANVPAVEPGMVAGAAPLTLTLSEALERAIAANPELAALHAKTAADAARIDEADDLENPELRLTDVNLRDGGDTSELTLRARPPLPGAVQARAEIARADFEQSSAQAERARQLLAVRVRELFDLALLQERAAALAAEAATLESRELALLEREVARGVTTRGDVAERALDSARTRRDCDRAARRMAASREALASLLAVPTATPVVPVGEPSAPASLEALGAGELVERALRARPEIRGAAASIDAAHAEAWLERAEQWPWLSFVQVGYDFRPSGAEAWQAGVAVDLPLFHRNRDGVRAAEADLFVVRRGFEAVVREIADEVRTSLAHARDAASDLERFRQGAARATASGRRAIAAARTLGQASEGDLVRAERRDIEATLTELELTEEYIAAFAELVAAVGELSGPASGN